MRAYVPYLTRKVGDDPLGRTLAGLRLLPPDGSDQALYGAKNVDRDGYAAVELPRQS